MLVCLNYCSNTEFVLSWSSWEHSTEAFSGRWKSLSDCLIMSCWSFLLLLHSWPPGWVFVVFLDWFWSLGCCWFCHCDGSHRSSLNVQEHKPTLLDQYMSERSHLFLNFLRCSIGVNIFSVGFGLFVRKIPNKNGFV